MYQTIRNMKVRDERGFTLVELLIVIAIIAILAAIAIPQFAAHRQRAVEASMTADTRSAAIVLETIFADTASYIAANDQSATGPAAITIDIGVAPAPVTTHTIRPSPGNTLSIASTITTYTITVTNAGARAGRTTHTLNNLGAAEWK